MIKGKKIMSAVLVGAMLLSATACSFGKVKPEVIIEAAESFAKSVTSLDGKKILKNVEDMDKDDANEFKEKLSLDDQDYDQQVIKKAVADTMKYEVDEDSVEVKKDSATCDVEFTLVDYADATGDLSGSADDFVSAISSSKKTKDYTVSLEFVKQDDSWLVSADSLDELDKLLSFIDYEFDIGTNIFEIIDTTYWYDNGYQETNYYADYENVYFIEYDVWFTTFADVYLYYEVYKDGTCVYTSSPEYVGDTYFEAYYDDYYGAETTSEGYIAQGEDTIEIYTEDGYLVASGTAYVSTSSVTTGTTGSGGTSGVYSDSITVYDESFANVIDMCWWDYDDTMIGEYAYDVYETETLAFSIEIEGKGPELYYEYYYLGGDDDDTDVDITSPVYTSYVDVTYYDDGHNYYNIDYTPDNLRSGIYVVFVRPDRASDAYVSAYCLVM